MFRPSCAGFLSRPPRLARRCADGVHLALAVALLAVGSGSTRGQDCDGNGESDVFEIEVGVSEDCNGNGLPDACELGPVRQVVSFAEAITYAVQTRRQTVIAGDFDGDGDVDLATANMNSNDVSILVNDGKGRFDFLKGTEIYKRRLGAVERPLFRLEVAA